MVNLESQLDSCQRTGVSRVTVGDRLSSQAGSLALSGAQQNDYVLGTILLSELLDPLLILQIHCTSGSSDEALRRGEHDFSASALRTGLDGLTGDTVTVTDDDDLLTG